jgi:hypothetical protein
VKIRERILRKLFPEVYQQADKAAEIIADYQGLKDSLKITDGVVTIEGPAGILGDLVNCKVSITPKINTELVLSKYELESMLKVTGNQELISQNLFTSRESKKAIKGISAKTIKEVDL